MSQVIRERRVAGGTLRLVQGDITLADTDAIVNAANSHLQHGGGVAGAIVRRGGRAIQEESDRVGFCAVGDAVVAGGGNLAARYVIHAVGPLGGDPEGDARLLSAVQSSLRRAEELGLRSISIPAISSGIFGFPKDRCARILLTAGEEHLAAGESHVQQIDFCLFDDETVRVFVQEWDERWGGDG